MSYNELSTIPVGNNRIIANDKVQNLVRCLVKAKQNGFQRIRFCKHFQEIELAKGYTLLDWLNETKEKNYKEIILGARIFPFIDPVDIVAEEEYLSNRFYFSNEAFNIPRTECLGLAAANIYNTLSISFPGAAIWETNSIQIEKQNVEAAQPETISVTNVFSSDCFEKPDVKKFVESISVVALVVSNIDPKNKPVHIRQDHGNDILKAFAKRIKNSPYVNAIVNSLPWNNKNTNFIRRVYPDGRIEVVLFWTDEGLGMVIKTTGRNQRETEEIARRLDEEYSY